MTARASLYPSLVFATPHRARSPRIQENMSTPNHISGARDTRIPYWTDPASRTGTWPSSGHMTYLSDGTHLGARANQGELVRGKPWTELEHAALRYPYNSTLGPTQSSSDFIVSPMSLNISFILFTYIFPYWILDSLLKVLSQFSISVIIYNCHDLPASTEYFLKIQCLYFSL